MLRHAFIRRLAAMAAVAAVPGILAWTAGLQGPAEAGPHVRSAVASPARPQGPADAGSHPSQSSDSRPLPPHDYSLVVAPGAGQADAALARLRDGMIDALRQSRLLPAGFPQVGAIVHTPSTTEPRAVRVSCAAADGEAGKSRCIRLGPASFLELSTVDFPDERAYLFEVFLFEMLPRGTLKRQAADLLARVMVHYPIFEDDLKPRPGEHLGDVIGALQRGLLAAGARPIVFR